MKYLVSSFFVVLIVSTASADYLDCSNNKERSTEIGFYNHDGKVSFQLSAPFQDEYLYVIGNCYSKNEVGLPYTCEAAAGVQAEMITLNLIEGAQGSAVAEVITHEDSQSTRELIACDHHQR